MNVFYLRLLEMGMPFFGRSTMRRFLEKIYGSPFSSYALTLLFGISQTFSYGIYIFDTYNHLDDL
jgi:hypothetical protein